MARQAVIVIHGIGEQRPMTTLRGFVKSLMKFEETITGGSSRFWAAPDRINQTLDLMRLSAPEVTVDGAPRMKTDFFEYYWAHSMRGHRYGHLYQWLKSLMCRIPHPASLRIKIFWAFSWLLLIFLFVLAVIGFSYLYNIWFRGVGFVGSFTHWVTLMVDQMWSWLFWTLLALGMFLILFNSIIINYGGDAARYLTRLPDNIAGRNAIIRNGVELLHGIHTSKKNYQRVVVVGHSLGSVIAYDMIRHYWNLVYKTYDAGAADLAAQIAIIEGFSGNFHSLKEDDMSTLRETQLNLNALLRLQNPNWLITDLITLGSPLSHADYLLANSQDEFQDRKLQREIPANPPKITASDGIVYSDSETQAQYFHHSAPFAVTRWANIFYPGDFIGGPVARSFGTGVRDYQILYSGGWLRRMISRYNPMSHNGYWEKRLRKISHSKCRHSIEILYELIFTGRAPRL